MIAAKSSLHRLGLLVAAMLIANTSCTACKKKGGSSSSAANAPAPVTALPAPGASTTMGAMVVQPAQIALTINATKPTAVIVKSVTADSTGKITTRQVAAAKLDSNGQAAFALPPGPYQVTVIGPKNAPIAADQVALLSSASAPLVDGKPMPLVSVPSARTTIAAAIFKDVVAKNPANFTKGYIDYRLIKAVAEVIGKHAAKTGKPVAPAVTLGLAAKIAGSTDTLAKALIAKGTKAKLDDLLDSALDPAAAFFSSVATAIQTPAVQLTCTKTADCSVDTPATLAAVTAAAGNAGSNPSQNDTAANVIAALPAAQADAFTQALLEQTLIPLLGQAGLPNGQASTDTTATSLSTGDKAMMLAMTVKSVKDVNALLGQVNQFYAAADPAQIPPVSDNLTSTYIYLAQSNFPAAMGSLRAVMGSMTAPQRAAADALIAVYLPTFQAFAAAAAGAAAFSTQVDADGAAAVASAAEDTTGSGSSFSYGGPCDQFAALASADQQNLTIGAAQIGDFCYLTDSTQACAALSPNLSSAAGAPQGGATYCDFTVFTIGSGMCSAFAALPPDIQGALENAAAVPALCRKDDQSLPCSTWLLTDNSAVPATCDYTLPPPYTAQYTALGQPCTALTSDLTSLSDPSPLYALLATVATDQQVVCTAFAAPPSGWPSSCEQIGATAGETIVTTSDSNCVYTVPAVATAPAFNLGMTCALLEQADPTFEPIFVSQLSLNAALLCTGFVASAAHASCASYSDPANAANVLQVAAAVQGDGSTNCVLDPGAFVLGTGSCASFQALSGPLQNMYAQAGNPGNPVCVNVAGAGGVCAALNGVLVADSTGGCDIPAPPFLLGQTCADFVNKAPQPSWPNYVAMLSAPAILVLCANAPGAGITCSTIDPTLTQDATGNCALQAAASFTLGDPCATFYAVEQGLWGGYVDAVTAAAPILCTGFAANPALGVSQCSDIDGRLTPDAAGNCVEVFATFALGGTCTAFSQLSESVREDFVNNQLSPANPLLCTDVGSSPFGTCDQITQAPASGQYNNSVTGATGPTGSMDCSLPPS